MPIVLVDAPAVRQCWLTHPRCDTVGPAAHDDRYRPANYLYRPSVSAQRAQAQPDGRYELTLKAPWRDGAHGIAPQMRQGHLPVAVNR